MSASTVHPEHVHVLLWAATRPVPQCGPLAWYYGNPTAWNQIDGPAGCDTRDDIGQMLLDENAASVNYLYNTDDQAETYTYHQPQHTGWSTAELLSALRGFEYQSCEHPDWEASQARAFCDALQQRLIYTLPGFHDGPWLIPPTASRPALRPVCGPSGPDPTLI